MRYECLQGDVGKTIDVCEFEFGYKKGDSGHDPKRCEVTVGQARVSVRFGFIILGSRIVILMMRDLKEKAFAEASSKPIIISIYRKPIHDIGMHLHASLPSLAIRLPVHCGRHPDSQKIFHYPPSFRLAEELYGQPIVPQGEVSHLLE